MQHLFYCLLLFFVSNQLFAQTTDTTFITVHVVYGSKPLVNKTEKWFGGKLGGHIGLEVAPGKVVHFNPGGKFRICGRKSEPGRYVTSKVSDFYCTFGCDSIKKLAVRIPVSIAKQQLVDSIGKAYCENPPYPYAFFGMRCAAACYHLLSEADVFPDYRKGKMIRKFFYPRRLRKRVLRYAAKNNWEIIRKEGSVTRKWDHD